VTTLNQDVTEITKDKKVVWKFTDQELIGTPNSIYLLNIDGYK